MKDEMSADTFWDASQQPGFPDEMAFRIEREQQSGRTFSAEALDSMASNMRTFLYARTSGQWKKTGRGPSRMTATLTIVWDDDSDLSEGGPWWETLDEGVALDGKDRLRATEKIGRFAP